MGLFKRFEIMNIFANLFNLYFDRNDKLKSIKEEAEKEIRRFKAEQEEQF